MGRKVDVAIIGAGSAGLAALRQIVRTTDNFLLIDQGPLGTTCARVGCMPSKALIEVARDYQRGLKLADRGIGGCDGLTIDIPDVLRHVRRMRDHFAGGMVEVTRNLAGDRLIIGRATLLGPDRIEVNGEKIDCNRIILAIGSKPVLPEAWNRFRDRILTTDNFFEQEDLPRRIALVGLGTNGIELGQALARLGIKVTGFGRNRFIGNLRDPEINRVAMGVMDKDFSLHVGTEAKVEMSPRSDCLLISNGSAEIEIDSFIATTGVVPNVRGLGLENLGVKLDKNGMPPFCKHSLQICNLPVFIVGDANNYLPVLHEAQDEGFIAGMNALEKQPLQYRRRTPLRIGFTDPQIGQVGTTFDQLNPDGIVIGRADFADQSRAVIEGSNAGMLHLYADRKTARLLGGEMVVPEAEHLAQLLAVAVQQELTVHEALMFPFYHPTVEEGLRSALRDAARQLADTHPGTEMALCESCPPSPLC
ncbi:MAG: dihydrolipoyl dehydrogenase [Syntrophotaleaceae bacterium]